MGDEYLGDDGIFKTTLDIMVSYIEAFYATEA